MPHPTTSLSSFPLPCIPQHHGGGGQANKKEVMGPGSGSKCTPLPTLGGTVGCTQGLPSIWTAGEPLGCPAGCWRVAQQMTGTDPGFQPCPLLLWQRGTASSQVPCRSGSGHVCVRFCTGENPNLSSVGSHLCKHREELHVCTIP